MLPVNVGRIVPLPLAGGEAAKAAVGVAKPPLGSGGWHSRTMLPAAGAGPTITQDVAGSI